MVSYAAIANAVGRMTDLPVRGDLTDRIAVCLVQTALAVAAEATSTGNYTNRQKLCNIILASESAPRLQAVRILLPVIMTSPVFDALAAGGAPADSDIQTVLSALFDSFAGRI